MVHITCRLFISHIPVFTSDRVYSVDIEIAGMNLFNFEVSLFVVIHEFVIGAAPRLALENPSPA
jgi:hypothetical protein